MYYNASMKKFLPDSSGEINVFSKTLIIWNICPEISEAEDIILILLFEFKLSNQCRKDTGPRNSVASSRKAEPEASQAEFKVKVSLSNKLERNWLERSSRNTISFPYNPWLVTTMCSRPSLLPAVSHFLV